MFIDLWLIYRQFIVILVEKNVSEKDHIRDVHVEDGDFILEWHTPEFCSFLLLINLFWTFIVSCAGVHIFLLSTEKYV